MNRNFGLVILFSFLFYSINSLAQGGELLIQQYSKGPRLDQNFSKWSIRLGPQLNRINTNLGTTSPTLTLGGLVELEYRLSKTVGLVSGAQFTPIHYSYPKGDSIATDSLKYITYPLLLRLQPTDKVSLGLGIIYQAFINGEKRVEIEDYAETTPYAEEIFKDSFGGVVQAVYHLNRRINIFANFRWIRRTSPPTQPQTNNTNGFKLGIVYRIWKSKLSP
jgi:hypothetical protein